MKHDKYNALSPGVRENIDQHVRINAPASSNRKRIDARTFAHIAGVLGLATVISMASPAQADVFGARTDTALIASWDPGYGQNTMAIADFNGDGRDDVALNDAGPGGYVRVLIRAPDGTLPPSSGAPGAETIFLDDWSGKSAAVVAIEVDPTSPGRELAIGPTRNGIIRVFKRIGANNWQLRETQEGGADTEGADMVAADFTGDGRKDLAAVSSQGLLRVYVQLGSGYFNRVAKVYVQGNGDAQAFAMAPVDVNGDGRLDVVVNYIPALRLPLVPLPVPLVPKRMVYRAMISSDTNGNFVRGVENRTSNQSTDPLKLVDASIGESLVPLACPGKPVLLLGINYDGTMHILEPGNELKWNTWVDLGVKSVNAVVRDFNGDGRLDVVTINQNQVVLAQRGSARLYNNVCANGFATASEMISYDLAVAANTVKALDVIGNDGRPELLTLPWFGSGSLSVTRNLSRP